MLAAIHFTPLMFAALGAWILCVCIHEFSHALVAYWGGDSSVRGKGYLTLDPTRYIDPVMSLLIPAIVLLMGGFPLPGGAVQIDWTRLRSRVWLTWTYAAGPISNFLLFLIFAGVLHPKLGLVTPRYGLQPTWVYFCGNMAVLNFLSTLINLIPVPPLDGFGMIEHRLAPEMQWKLRQPQVAFASIAILFFIMGTRPFGNLMFTMLEQVCSALGLPFGLMGKGYELVMFDQAP
jgi:Zn-dependent protease